MFDYGLARYSSAVTNRQPSRLRVRFPGGGIVRCEHLNLKKNQTFLKIKFKKGFVVEEPFFGSKRRLSTDGSLEKGCVNVKGV